MVKLAELFVDITGRDGGLSSTLSRARGSLSGIVGAAMSAQGAILGALGAGGIAGGMYKAVSAANDFNSTLAKSEQIFGGAAGAIQDAAEQMAEAFGTSKQEFMDSAVNFGAVFKGAGKSKEDAAGLGVALAKLGIDMAAFDDVSNAEAFGALSSALRGEFDPLERFRVFLSAAKIEEEALRAGLVKQGEALTESAKKQATLNLILAQTADAQGTAAREADQAGSKQKAIWGRISNAMADFGQSVAPLWNTVLDVVASAMEGISGWLESNKQTIESWVAWIQGGLATLGVLWRNWGDVVAIAQLGVQEKLMNVGAVFSWLMESARAMAGWFAGNWTNLIRDTFVGVYDIISNVFTNIRDLFSATWEFITNPTGGFKFEFTPLLEGFKAATEALPEIAAPAFVSLQKDIDAIGDRMANREIQRADEKAKAAADLAKRRADASKLGVPGEGGATEAATEARKARTSSLTDFASTLQEGVFGKGKLQQEQLKAQQEQLKVQREQLSEQKKSNTKGAAPAVAI